MNNRSSIAGLIIAIGSIVLLLVALVANEVVLSRLFTFLAMTSMWKRTVLVSFDLFLVTGALVSLRYRHSRWQFPLAALHLAFLIGLIPGFMVLRLAILFPEPHHWNRPLSPQEAVARMSVPTGFQVELVASEPKIINPIAMSFDERGRIWVAESLEYPRLSPGQGRDRIKILEDSTGDGRINRTTVFADDLNIPSGIALGYGGVWVANAPDILFLRDTDGDDKMDHREVIVTGFGREDAHELPNSLTWGPDGWLYGLNGVFNPSHVEQQGKVFDFSCAMFRIHPRTHEFELFAEGTSNPWGIAWNENGDAFISACVIDHLWHITETGYYEHQASYYPPYTWKIDSIVNHQHQSAAYSGLCYFNSDAYPAEYRDRLYMGNIHGGCINVDKLRSRGSTFLATPEADFLSANDPWFMPVAVNTGPDGCLYILDWYDRFHCYHSARRHPQGVDRSKGRLYRVRYQDSPRAQPFDLTRESDEQLIGRLASSNIYLRKLAQRLLTERGNAATRPKLWKLVFDASAHRRMRLHALFVLIGSAPLEAEQHLRLLTHADESFQAWGVRAAGNQRSVEPKIADQIVALAKCENPIVQVQVAIALRKLANIEALAPLVDIVCRCEKDALVERIVWQNLHPMLEDHSDQFLAIARSKRLFASPSGRAMSTRFVERMLPIHPFDADRLADLFQLLHERPDRLEEATKRLMLGLARKLQDSRLDDKQAAQLHRAFSQPLSVIVDSGPSAPCYLEATMLSTALGQKTDLSNVQELFVSHQSSADERLRALDVLIAVDHPELLSCVESAMEDQRNSTTEFRAEVISALGRSTQADVGRTVLAVYHELDAELKPLALDLVTQRVTWAKQLVTSVDQGELNRTELNAEQIRRLAHLPDQELTRKTRQVWGTVRSKRDPARDQVIEEFSAYLPQHPGDPHRGQIVFQKICSQCHTIYGQGHNVGPDLTSNGRGSFDQLLSNVLDPSLVIGAAYQSRLVRTTDGRVLTGILVSSNDHQVVLKVQGGKLETISRNMIEQLTVSPLSLMPEGIENQLRRDELADLFAFLTLDKPPDDPAARPIPGGEQFLP